MFADVVDGFTFGSRRRSSRKRRDRDEYAEPEPQREHRVTQDPDDLDRDWPRDNPRPHPRRAPPPQEPEPAPSADSDAPPSSVRSYTWTGGRTRSNYQLELETLVSTSESYRPGPTVRMEHQSIAEICRHPRSVAEVGALLSVPVGVAKVLLADMAELGLITVHQTVTESGSAPHLMLMERVLSGLRRL